MRPMKILSVAALLLVGLARAFAQQPAPPPAPPQQFPPPQRDFPAHQKPPGDPAQIERGSTLYGIHCRLCHGPDLRGGDMGGVNLLRSQLVLNDQDGELIGQVVTQGRMNPGSPPMPPIGLPPDDVKAVAAFVRATLAKAARQGGPPPGPPVELNIVVGDAAAGQRFFEANCASCHSASGDLAGLATRYPEPMLLQNAWVSGNVGGGGRRGRGGPGGGAGPFGPGAAGAPAADEAPPRAPKPVMVTVTTKAGQRYEGKLDRIDDFIVVLTGADGAQRTFRRPGASLDVQISDPLAGHKQLLRKYTDKDIHDVTAYLVTLK